MECEFCKKTFVSNSSLNNHKKTAKYCLEIQGKINNIENIYKCKCDKIFTTKQHFITHNQNCVKIKIEEIENNENKLLKEELIKKEILLSSYKEQLEKQENNYKQQISELQKIIERMGTKAIEKPTTTNNNTTNNNTKINLVPFDLTNEYVSNIITSKFNDVHVLEGVHGLAKFVKDKIITLEDGTLVYRCFDTSRQIFKYQDKNGNIVKDPKALKLIEMIQPALKEQTNTLYDFFNTEIDNYKKEEDEKRNEFLTTKDKMLFLKENTIKIQDEIADMHMNSRFCNELSALTS
jgi:hypothetical protein